MWRGNVRENQGILIRVTHLQLASAWAHGVGVKGEKYGEPRK